uniref:Uncharacterized protein n=1 Tax=Polynucleobacter necessarius subsp. necessarius (strain STIR1) TaxID=452638 RepID=B1XT20_POLNS
MGCTSADLMRWLPQALGELHTNTSLVVDGQVLKEAAHPQLRIFGSSQSVRKIVLLEIPVLQVRLQFSESWSQDDCEVVLNRFDLCVGMGG